MTKPASNTAETVDGAEAAVTCNVRTYTCPGGTAAVSKLNAGLPPGIGIGGGTMGSLSGGFGPGSIGSGGLGSASETARILAHTPVLLLLAPEVDRYDQISWSCREPVPWSRSIWFRQRPI